jgi:hypothetical protein
MPEDMRVDDGGGRQKIVRLEYPSNSQNAPPKTPEEKKVDQVVTGEVIRRKRSPFAKLTQNFVTEDSGSVIEYLLVEVLVPAAKSLVYDIFTQGLERKLYGEARPKSPNQRGSYTNYAAKTRSGTGVRYNTGGTVTPLNRMQRVNHDFSEIILERRSDAEDVLDKLRDLIGDYGMATVNDFYDLIGLTGEFTDDKWGWRDLRNARIHPTRDGYTFGFPKTSPVA